MKKMILVIAGVIALIGTAAALVQNSDSTQAENNRQQVVQIDEMSSTRAAHQATALQSGDVLISGGCFDGCERNLRTTELYSPGSKVLRASAAMTTARGSHIAIALNDGRVLVAGGWSERDVSDSAEIYDADSQRFNVVGKMTIARAAPRASLLADGRVLISGGQSSAFEPLAESELFDPKSARFSATKAMSSPRLGHVSVALKDGRVLIVGGRQTRRGETLRTAELFDPATLQFHATGEMTTPRHKHAAALLADGRVLVIGGSDARDSNGRYRSTEIYDPQTGKFSDGPDMHWPRFKIPDAVATLPSGAVLVAGGANHAELFDPVRNIFVTVPGELTGQQSFATASVLPDGSVLVLGGYDEQIRTSAAALLVHIP